jgi:ABC-type multidrug transport system fused ATPase/permease subunit
MKQVLKIVIFSFLAIGSLAHAELSEYEKVMNKAEKQASTWKYEMVLQEKLDEDCGRGFGSSEFLGIGLDEVKEKSVGCLAAKKALKEYKEYLYKDTATSFNEKAEYAYEKMNTYKQEQDSSASKPYITISIGKYVFQAFYGGLKKWVGADGNSQGKFQVFAKEVTPILEKSMVLLIIAFASAAFFNKFTQYLEKVAKAFLAFVIVLSFLEWNTFNYWIFEPLLSLLIATMKVLFDTNAQGLGDVIFGVDEHFERLFASIEAYDKLLEEKGVWYSFQIFKQIVAYLIVGMFGALYAIFTILIIVGFFGFMLLLG